MPRSDDRCPRGRGKASRLSRSEPRRAPVHGGGLGDSQGALITAIGEVGLVAPSTLGRLVDDIATLFVDAMTSVEPGAPASSGFTFYPLQQELIRAMRADLGEPVSPEEIESQPDPGEAEKGPAEAGPSVSSV